MNDIPLFIDETKNNTVNATYSKEIVNKKKNSEEIINLSSKSIKLIIGQINKKNKKIPHKILQKKLHRTI